MASAARRCFMASFDKLADSVNDQLIELQGRTGENTERIRAEVQTGTGVQTVQGLAAANILFEGDAAPAVRVAVTTDELDTVVLSIAGAGEMAKKAQLVHQADVTALATTASAGYVQAELQATIDKLNAVITAFNALIAEQQSKGHML